MEVLVLDGKNYIKASKAARNLGYATDYVGQLCRSGQVDAHLIGRTWYVNEDQLSTHRVEKKRMSRVKAREQAQRLIAENRSKISVGKAQNNYKRLAISYETDPTPLIPETRKISVVSETPVRVIEEEVQETVIENKGEKVLMSGDLEVIDVTDVDVSDGTTLLKPKIIRSAPVDEVRKEKESVRTIIPTSDSEEDDQDEDSEADNVDESTEEIRPTFMDRIEQAGNEESHQESVTLPQPFSDPQNTKKTESDSFFMHFVVLAGVLILVLASCAVQISMQYDAGVLPVFNTSWSFSIERALTLMSERLF